MSARKFTVLAVISLALISALAAGCDTDNNYDERTVVYVSNINEGYPYISDVINQGDSIFYSETNIFKLEDDYIIEDWTKVEFHNRPYNQQVDVGTSSLGDFLVTGYTVEFIRLDGDPTPLVQPFSGQMSLHVPANSKVEAVILLVPYAAKNSGILQTVQYSNLEYYTNAQITFYGHEIQTDREIQFSAGLMVNFVDIFTDEDPNEH